MVPPVNDRDLDVVVFGATGITGRQVCRYLAERVPADGPRWAAAARDLGKLGRVLGEVGVVPPETVVADLNDPESLAAMAGRTKVVLNLCGPYTLYGRPVIEACVARGAHYVDLTGEIPFVREMIDEVDARAQEAGVKIVEVCGFEALPPDLAVALAAEAARDRYGERLAEVELEASVEGPPGLPRPSDLLSGGTLQSLAAAAGGENADAVADAAALIVDPALAETVRKRSPIRIAPRRGFSGAVIAPMAPAAFINPAVIQRTAALSAEESGERLEPFRYREGVALAGSAATLPLRYVAAGAISGTQAGVLAAARARPSVRRRIGSMLSRILPSSGFGPSGDRLEQWKWQMSVRARAAGGQEVAVEIDADGQPGYLTTARMLGEVGLLLAEAGATPERAGCVTPAIALGTGAAERLKRAGVRFSVAGKVAAGAKAA
jgi:short subunit dehydrogenase-like uncharacterized protein